MMLTRSLLALLLVVSVGCDSGADDTDGGMSPDAAAASDDAGAPAPDAGGPDAAPALDAGVETGTPVWVGVGAWGFRSSTGDGVTWTTTLNPEQANDHSPDLLRDVSYGDGVFIAVGGDRNSMVMRSTDGVTWEEDLHPSGGQWKGGVAYGGGRWIAVGGVGTTIYSDDGGSSWTDGPTRLPSAGRNVAWGNGRFVAVGDSGMIAVSTDALAWTDQTMGDLRLGGIAYGTGVWVATGSVWNGTGFDTVCFESADDAETWTACPFTATRFDGAVSNGGSLIVSHGEGYEIHDGSSWRRVETNIPDTVYEADGTWVGVNGARRSHGPSLDALTMIDDAERGFRSFTRGWVRTP